MIADCQLPICGAVIWLENRQLEIGNRQFKDDF
jgi:hypothetical protein